MPPPKRLHDVKYAMPSPFAADRKVVLDDHDPFGTPRAFFGGPPEGFGEVEILAWMHVRMCVKVCVKCDGRVFELVLGVRERGVGRGRCVCEDGERGGG